MPHPGGIGDRYFRQWSRTRNNQILSLSDCPPYQVLHGCDEWRHVDGESNDSRTCGEGAHGGRHVLCGRFYTGGWRDVGYCILAFPDEQYTSGLKWAAPVLPHFMEIRVVYLAWGTGHHATDHMTRTLVPRDSILSNKNKVEVTCHVSNLIRCLAVMLATQLSRAEH